MSNTTTKAQAPADGYASSFIPPWAVTCWCDDAFIYVALPSKVGPPYIQKFALTEGGMSKAVNILRVQRREISKGRVHRESPAPINRRERPKPLNDKDREMVLGILKKVGLV